MKRVTKSRTSSKRKKTNHVLPNLSKRTKRIISTNIATRSYVPGQKTTALQPRNVIVWRNAYYSNGTIPTSTAVTNVQFMLNSLYDCFQTGAANTQPVGYDDYCPTLYEKYRVWSGKIIVRVKRGYLDGGHDWWIAAFVSRSPTGPTSLRQAMVQPGAKIYELPMPGNTNTNTSSGGDSKTVIISRTFNVLDYTPREEVEWTTTSASPTNELNLWVCFGPMDGGDFYANENFWYEAEIVQKSEMGQRITNCIATS